MSQSCNAREKQPMTSPVYYILVSLTLTSAMISVVFFLAWKTLGETPHALSWSIAFLAASLQWMLHLFDHVFPNYAAYWLSVNALALVAITLGLRGHCQRTDCRTLPQNLWPYTALIFSAIAWTTVVDVHIGISTALAPGAAALALYLSAFLVLRHREKTRPAEYAAAITMAIFGMAQMTASGMALLQGAAGEVSFQILYMDFNFLTIPAGYTGMAMFIIFMLASDLSEQMKEIAIRDQLTGLLNRRGFGEQAAKAFASARRGKLPVSVVMTDIDRFKDINDEFGHAAGDAALRLFSEVLIDMGRPEDVLARVGGEEFAIVLPGTSLTEAIRVADQLCTRIEETPMHVADKAIVMTASFGVATLSDKDSCLTDIVLRADRALYRSKRAGRNRVDTESSQVLRVVDGVLRPISVNQV